MKGASLLVWVVGKASLLVWEGEKLAKERLCSRRTAVSSREREGGGEKGIGNLEGGEIHQGTPQAGFKGIRQGGFELRTFDWTGLAEAGGQS